MKQYVIPKFLLSVSGATTMVFFLTHFVNQIY